VSENWGWIKDHVAKRIDLQSSATEIGLTAGGSPVFMVFQSTEEDCIVTLKSLASGHAKLTGNLGLSFEPSATSPSAFSEQRQSSYERLVTSFFLCGY